MRILALLSLLFVLTSFNPPLADTWDGTASNQLPTGNALNNGGYGVSIPSGFNKKALTKAEMTAYTNVLTGNEPIASMASNQCPTKQDILDTL